jgi:hypothetical protein
MEWDPGPSPQLQQVFEAAPLTAYLNHPTNRFRVEWGPIYYRGRADGTARVVVVGQDPAADENIARRVMVGTAGQRVQGLLTKLGLTRSYVIVNSILYSIRGQYDQELRTFTNEPAIRQWTSRLLDALTAGNKVEAVIGLGAAARRMIQRWPGRTPFITGGRVLFLTHPTARPDSVVTSSWNAKLPSMLAVITPDADGVQNPTLYGSTFQAADSIRIPLRDFSFGAASWMGTGNVATRVTSPQLPAEASTYQTILHFAIGPQG